MKRGVAIFVNIILQISSHIQLNKYDWIIMTKHECNDDNEYQVLRDMIIMNVLVDLHYTKCSICGKNEKTDIKNRRKIPKT